MRKLMWCKCLIVVLLMPSVCSAEDFIGNNPAPLLDCGGLDYKYAECPIPGKPMPYMDAFDAVRKKHEDYETRQVPQKEILDFGSHLQNDACGFSREMLDLFRDAQIPLPQCGP